MDCLIVRPLFNAIQCKFDTPSHDPDNMEGFWLSKQSKYRCLSDPTIKVHYSGRWCVSTTVQTPYIGTNTVVIVGVSQMSSRSCKWQRAYDTACCLADIRVLVQLMS
jgi:hypothetical protein